jgi:8-oxo-dGTP pyrophosphatase MutT (NUDIX family)
MPIHHVIGRRQWVDDRGAAVVAADPSWNTLCHHAWMPIRPAATIVMARPAEAAGVEVLMLSRSARSRFAPGFVVFPGGAVEPKDHEDARRWFGSEVHVARACALRELAEETGLVVTARGVVACPGGLPGTPDLPATSVHDVPEMARWIAPDFLPVRFDAVFFAAAAPREIEPTPDSVEVDRAWWGRPLDVLEAQRLGTAPLLWPTLKTLEALVECRSVDDVLRLRVQQVAPPRPGA